MALVNAAAAGPAAAAAHAITAASVGQHDRKRIFDANQNLVYHGFILADAGSNKVNSHIEDLLVNNQVVIKNKHIAILLVGFGKKRFLKLFLVLLLKLVKFVAVASVSPCGGL